MAFETLLNLQPSTPSHWSTIMLANALKLSICHLLLVCFSGKP
jgi:hypothetical protein